MNPLKAYLKGRGITVTLPSDIRYQPPQNGRIGAMVLAARDNNGKIIATQSVFIDGNKKAAIKVPKRTNGVMKGAAVRLPAFQGNELVIAEGPETALSVWQAWRRETWVALGSINNLVETVPVDSTVVIARDADKPGSQADKGLLKSVSRMRQRGVSVRVVSPPNPTHFGYDFNDALVEYGNNVVAEQLENEGFIKPRYAPQTGSVFEAREAVHSAFSEWTGALPAYWQKKAAYSIYQAELVGDGA